jgi:K+-transporting ATPase ATPase C chain
MNVRADLRAAIVAVIATTVVFGLAYPLAMTGVAQTLFNGRADGSLVHENGRVVGSRLIGQDFKNQPRYFQSRPSQTGSSATATGFANRGPNQRSTAALARQLLRAYLARERPYTPGLRAATVPVSAVTTSASGVDPHISLADARIQARRVAAVRKLPLQRVLAIVDDATDETLGGLIGDAGVNVLEANLAFDREARR